MTDARRLAAIMAVDVVGYSALMGQDELGTARAVREQRNAMVPLIRQRGGRIVKTMGDGLLLEFSSVVEALGCAIEIQQVVRERNSQAGDGKQLVYRIGVHLGDVIVDGDDILGEGVNIAARLEGICAPGGIAISGAAHEHVRGRIDVSFVDLGERVLKNIARPVRVFSVGSDPAEDGSDRTDTHQDKGTPPARPEKPSIAVLAFQNLSGDPDQEYFADGITEDLITALSTQRQFLVIARNSAFSFKGRSVDIRQIGRELGVRYVIEGTVRRSGPRLRISAQLVEAETRTHIWADRFDGDVVEIFDFQDKVTGSIAQAVEPNLQAAEFARTKTKLPRDLNAYDLYLRALFRLGSVDKASHMEAMVLLRDALALDPQYADAMALLAVTLGQASLQGWTDYADRSEALRLAREAVRLDRQNPSVLAIAASSEALYGGSYEASDVYCSEALRIAPNGAHVRINCAVAFMYGGRSEDAIIHYEAAIRQSPLDPYVFRATMGLVAAHFFARRFDESIRQARRIIEENPTVVITRRFLSAALALAGHVEEARTVMTELRRLAPDSSLARSAESSFRHKWQMDMYLEGLRLAGLPEEADVSFP
ncbi:MAG: adenylate/guanylate cyclase domain-containing protein [Alsobacter sp.]